MTLLVFAVGGSHITAAFCSERFRAMAVTLHAVGTAALGGAIFLAGQIFNLQEHWPTGLLLWAVGAVAGWWLLREWPQLAFAAVAAPLWLIGEWSEASSNVAGSSQIAAAGAALLAICYLTVRNSSPQLERIGIRGAHAATTYSWIGGIALFPTTLAVAVGHWRWNFAKAEFGPLAILGWAGALLIPLAFTYVYRRRHAWVNGVAALWVVGLSWISEQRMDAATYAWCAIGCAGMIAWGIFELRRERVNLGMAGFALTITCFFFSSVMDKLGRSTSLIVLGTVFLGGGWYWEKLRRRLVEQIRTGGAQ